MIADALTRRVMKMVFSWRLPMKAATFAQRPMKKAEHIFKLFAKGFYNIPILWRVYFGFLVFSVLFFL
jgi:hypothetical protein